MLTAVLVGCGAMSKAWLEAAARIPQLQIVGLVDIDIDRACGRAKEFSLNDVETGTDLSAVLKQTKPTMVFDVALPQVRLELVQKAFSHGCHVLTEKPMAVSLSDAREIIRLAKVCGLKQAVVQNRRYLAMARRIRRFLDSGTLGKPSSIHCDFFLAPHFGGFREEMDNVLLVDMAIHTFDSARYMINADAINVFCREWDPGNSWYTNGSSAVAVFEMSGGAIFTYRGSWSAKGLRTSWESAWRIVCERGSLVWDGYGDIRAEIDSGKQEGLFDVMNPVEVAPLDPGDAVGGHQGIIESFIRSVESNTEPETSGSDNIKSLGMVFGAVESAKINQPVSILV